MSRCARQNIGRITRRMLLSAAGVAAAAPVLAEECRIGPSPHERGPLVWMDYDQVELDAAYDQLQYAPLMGQNIKRQASLSEEVRGRLGQPLHRQYGQTEVEALDIYRTNRPNAPVFVFFMAALGSSDWQRTMASRQSCSSEQASTTSLSISSPSKKRTAISAEWPIKCAVA